MIVCQSLAEAAAVPNVVMVVASNPPVAYVQGDVLPTFAIADNTTENARQAGVDGAINAGTLGTVTPASITDLKAMTAAQFSTWFDANFTTAAQMVAVLKRITLIVIRRVL